MVPELPSALLMVAELETSIPKAAWKAVNEIPKPALVVVAAAAVRFGISASS
jgi:hypothetical protein